MFEYFYHEIMRRTIIGFGSLFNDITIKHTNDSDSTVSNLKVPLAYGPVQKFLARLEQQPSLDNREFAVTLPRIGFEIAGLEYDPTRKLNKVQKFRQVKEGEDGKVINYQYTPVPYNISYNLFCFTATAENGLQIVEQIVPFFQPDYTVTINMVPNLGIKRDVPIVLNSTRYEDSYDGAFTQRRAVIYTLNFTAKTYLFGPMSNQKVVKKVQSDLGTDTDSPLTREERIIVIPNPTTANADDDFGFTTSISFFNDSKRFDPNSGNDT